METKPALFCTEFYMTVFLQIILTLNTLQIWQFVPVKYAWASILAQAILGSFYAASRGLAKSGKSVDPALKSNYTLLPTKKKAGRRLPAV